MIAVQSKILEVGDNVVFRCGGKATITRIDDRKEYNWVSITFNNEYNTKTYYRTGYKNLDGQFDITDIIDVEKKPKPIIVEYHDTFFAYKNKFKFEAIIKYDKTNNKIINVEVVE